MSRPPPTTATAELLQLSLLPLSIGKEETPARGSSTKRKSTSPQSVAAAEAEEAAAVAGSPLSEAAVFIRASARLPLSGGAPVPPPPVPEEALKQKSKSKAAAAAQLRAEQERDFHQREVQWQRVQEEDERRRTEEDDPALQLGDTLTYVNATFLSEVAYGKPLSQHARDASSGITAPSSYVSAYAARVAADAATVGPLHPTSSTNSSHTQIAAAAVSPGSSAATAVGYAVRADGSRQYVAFPVEEQRYVFSCVVPPAVYRLMGDALVPWLLATAVRGYAVPSTLAASARDPSQPPVSSPGLLEEEQFLPLYLPLDARLKTDYTAVPASPSKPPPFTSSLLFSVKHSMERQLQLLVPLFDRANTATPSGSGAPTPGFGTWGSGGDGDGIGGKESSRVLWWRAKRSEVRQLCTERHSAVRFHPRFLQQVRGQTQEALRGEAHRMGLHGVMDHQRRFKVTGYALWLHGEPVATNATHNTLEEVLVPAAISSTLEFGAAVRDRSWGGITMRRRRLEALAAAELDPTLSANSTIGGPLAVKGQAQPSAAASKTSDALREQQRLAAALAAGSMLLEGAGEADGVQVRCSAMYSSRLAARLARGGAGNARGVVLPTFRPEDARSRSPGLLAISVQTKDGWLLTAELEALPQRFSGAPLHSILSGAQELLVRHFAAPEFLRSMQASTAVVMLRRPVSLYSPSCIPLIQLVHEFRVFYFEPSVSVNSPAGRGGGGGRQEHQLRCLFHLRTPATLNTDKRLIKDVEKGRNEIAEAKDPAAALLNVTSPSGDHVMQRCLQEERERAAKRLGGGNAQRAKSEPKKEAKKAKQHNAPPPQMWAKDDSDLPVVVASVRTTRPPALYPASVAALGGKEHPRLSSIASAPQRAPPEDVGESWLQGREELPFWEMAYWPRVQQLLRLSTHLARRTSVSGRAAGGRPPALLAATATPPGGDPAAVSPSPVRSGCTTSPALQRSIFSSLRLSNVGSHGKMEKEEEFIFHGIVAPSNRISNGARDYSSCSGFGGGKSSAPGAVLFVLLTLKPRKEQKALLFLPHHKDSKAVVDSREYRSLSEKSVGGYADGVGCDVVFREMCSSPSHTSSLLHSNSVSPITSFLLAFFPSSFSAAFEASFSSMDFSVQVLREGNHRIIHKIQNSKKKKDSSAKTVGRRFSTTPLMCSSGHCYSYYEVVFTAVRRLAKHYHRPANTQTHSLAYHCCIHTNIYIYIYIYIYICNICVVPPTFFLASLLLNISTGCEE
eukprot:gene7445-5243_t